MKKINEIKVMQSKMIALQKQVMKGIKDLEKDVRRIILKRWKETFPNNTIEFIATFEGGCLTDKWQPDILIGSINLADFCKGKWYKAEIVEDTLFDITWVPVKPPVPMKKLRQFLKDVSIEIGCPIHLYSRTIKNG